MLSARRCSMSSRRIRGPAEVSDFTPVALYAPMAGQENRGQSKSQSTNGDTAARNC
jgi:hypothetical protein